jgi:hypothetical protein
VSDRPSGVGDDGEAIFFKFNPDSKLCSCDSDLKKIFVPTPLMIHIACPSFSFSLSSMTRGRIVFLILLNFLVASGSVLQSQNEKLPDNGTGGGHIVEKAMLPCVTAGNISQKHNRQRILSRISREAFNAPDDDHSSSNRSHFDLEGHLNVTSGGQGSKKNDTGDQYWDAAHQTGMMKMQSLRFRKITENTTG